MGNSCECIRRQSRDEAEDALLASLAGDSPTEGRPRGPPPPYQPQAPVYSYPLSAMTEERRLQLVRTVTIIQSLPCIPYEVRGDKDKKKDPRECAICMMDYSAGEPIKLLPCMHYYHLHCIDDWLMRSLTCPSCMQRVDAGLISTLSSSGGTTSSRGRSLGFSLRRRRRTGTTTGDGEDPLVSGPASSSSSSRSSSTSSSREHLTIGGQQSSRSNVPFSPSHQLQSPRRITPSNSGTIFLPPFPSPRVPSRNIGPLPQIVSPPSSPGVFLINPSPPHSPQPLHVTIHTLPSPSPPPPPPPENPSPPPPPPNQQQISQVN